MKILWHSQAPWSNTAFAGQTALFTPRLRDAGYDVAISATEGIQGRPVPWNGIRVYPCNGNSSQGWGEIERNARLQFNGEPGVVITLCDPYAPYYRWNAENPLLSFIPMEWDPLPSPIAAYLENTGATPLALTRNGEAVFREAGFDSLYVPHGIDTSASEGLKP